MKIHFLQVAQIELDEAIEYYNYQVSGLGNAFLADIISTLDRIAKFPDAGSHALNAQEELKPDGFLTELFTRKEIMKFSLSQLQTSTENRTTGTTGFKINTVPKCFII